MATKEESADGGPSRAGAESSLLARRSAFNFVGLASASALQFGLVVVLAAGLGKHDAGVFFEAFAALRLLSVLAVLGLDVTAVRYVSMHLARGEHETAASAVRVAVRLAVGASSAVALITFALAPAIAHQFGTHDLETVLRIMIVSLPATVLQMVYVGATRGTGRMRSFVVVDQILDGGVRFAAIAGALILGTGLTGIAWAYTGAAYLVLAASWVAAKGLTRSGAAGVHVAELVRFSSYQWAASLAAVGLLWVDTLLLGLWRTPEEVAVYSIATRTVLAGLVFILPIGIALQPQIGRLYTLSDMVGLLRLYQTATKWSTLVGVPPLVLLALFASPALDLLYGHAYAGGATALTLLAVGQIANAATGPCGHIVTMVGRSDLVLQNSLAALVLNLLLNAILIPQYGMTGAGLAWGASIVAWNMLRLFQVHQVLHMHPFGSWMAGVGIALLVFTLTAGASRVLLDGASPLTALVAGTLAATTSFAAVLLVLDVARPADLRQLLQRAG